MENQQVEQPTNNQPMGLKSWLKESITARLLIVGFLLLILLIPLESVKSLIAERHHRQEDVVKEVGEKWGNSVTLNGLILKIPYQTYKKTKIEDEKGRKSYLKKELVIRNMYISPKELSIVADVQSKELHRSLYQTSVYNAALKITGKFPLITAKKLGIPKENILWNQAKVMIRTTNLKGIKNIPVVQFGGDTLQMNIGRDIFQTLESDNISNFAAKHGTSIPFVFHLVMNGSKSLNFVPIGEKTTVKMSSNWKNPSFTGSYLPKTREISDTGFSATWELSRLNRPFGQLFKDGLPSLEEYALGTNFILTVDKYKKNERSAKYGFMVIGLTLLVFLLIQLTSKIYIHPFQYVMIGLGLVMFYTLLLSFSEHISYFSAYLISGGAVLVMLGLYAHSILKGFKFPLLICSSLFVLYSFIYVIIQMEDYALLVGSIGLFLILATVMYASRKIDWNTKA